MKRVCFFGVIALMVLLLFASCGESVPQVETLPFENWQQYTIVRPDSSDGGTVEAAKLISKTVQEQFGAKLTLTTDWVKRGEEAPTDTLEILVGHTNRAESAKGLKYNDYCVEFVNDRLVITGGSNAAVLRAAEWYVENCVGDGLLIPAEPYSYTEEYPFENVSINGIFLRDLNVYEYDKDTEFANEFRRFVADNAGRMPGYAMSGTILRTGYDPALAVDEIGITAKDGGLYLETSEYGYGRMDALALLFDLIEQRESDQIVIDERVTIPMDGFKTATEKQLSDWKKQADDLRTEILATPNMEIPKGATVYYISEKGNDANDGKSPAKAWKTIAHMNAQMLAPGSYVCFERGGEYRGKFNAQAGVTYTAYGTGDKPILNGSPFNAAEHGKWTSVAENVWVYSEKFDKDVGGITFDEGEAFGIKTVLAFPERLPVESITGKPFNGVESLAEWKEELRFWHDHENAAVNPDKPTSLYLYCSEGNPGEVFERIEFMTHGNLINVSTKSDVTINNLCIRYTGSHGIGAGTCNNLTVTDCEVGFIGGSHHSKQEGGKLTRFGNGIEIYGGCNNYLIDHCWVYQCYDAGITHQYSAVGSNKIIMDGVTYTNNLIEDCIYNIEFFLGRPESGAPTRYMKDIVMRDNILLSAADGWGQQRPDGNAGAHIKGWDHMNTLEENFVIENNLMIGSNRMMIHVGVDEIDDLPIVRNNIFVQYLGGQFARFGKNYTQLMLYSIETVTRPEFADNEFYTMTEQ